MTFLRAAVFTVAMAVPVMGQEVGLLVAPFEGPGNLGARTATVLNLQVWQTLRAAPHPNPHGLNFGSGTVYFMPEGSMPVRSHIEAERAADGQAQAVLWGRAQPYGDGVVVQAYLSVPRATSPGHPGGTAIWKIALPDGQSISVDIPAWRYEFAPIVLRTEAVLQLNTPEGLKLYRSPQSSEVLGSVGSRFRALEQSPNGAKVESAGITGWVRLPQLSRNRSEVVDFTGALVRIFRKDWGGALELFSRVVGSQTAPATIKAYSLLMMAAASEQVSHQTGQASRAVEFVNQSYRLNPYLQATVRYKCMAHLEDMARTTSAKRQLAETVARNEYLFPKTDRWIGKVKAVLAR